jgi:hypothetical protein
VPSRDRAQRPVHIHGNNKEKEKYISGDKSSEGTAATFEDFWATYPTQPYDRKGQAGDAWQSGIQDGADPAELVAAAAAYAAWTREEANAWHKPPQAARWLAEHGDASYDECAGKAAPTRNALPEALTVNVTEDCPPEAAARWQKIVRTAVHRHGRATAASWFKDLRFDGDTVWTSGRFIRDQVLNRFENELDGLPVKVGPPGGERAPP